MENKDVLNLIKSGAKILFDIAVILVNIIIQIILIGGAIAALILLAKSYPYQFKIIAVPLMDISWIIYKIAIFALSASISLFIWYLLSKYLLIPFLEKVSLNNKKRREELRKKLVNDIVIKLRRKR